MKIASAFAVWKFPLMTCIACTGCTGSIQSYDLVNTDSLFSRDQGTYMPSPSQWHWVVCLLGFCCCFRFDNSDHLRGANLCRFLRFLHVGYSYTLGMGILDEYKYNEALSGVTNPLWVFRNWVRAKDKLIQTRGMWDDIREWKYGIFRCLMTVLLSDRQTDKQRSKKLHKLIRNNHYQLIGCNESIGRSSDESQSIIGIFEKTYSLSLQRHFLAKMWQSGGIIPRHICVRQTSGPRYRMGQGPSRGQVAYLNASVQH